MKFLCVNAAFSRLNSPGAAELDWFALLDRLAALGHTLVVLQPYLPGQSPADVIGFYGRPLLEIVPIPLDATMRDPRRLTHPAYLDGAGWQYASPAFTRQVQDAIRTYRPDALFAVMSFLWGAVRAARRAGIPTILRSQNNEARHLLQENGVTLPNLIRYMGKAAGERQVARLPSAVAAITPDEAAFYHRLAPGAHIETLPLGTLPALLRPAQRAVNRTPLHVFFMGSSYNVPHNRRALDFITREIVPRLRARAAGAFTVHILGSKVPTETAALASADLIFEGYVPDLDAFLAGMDIALIPSLGGAGMQQKAFEPLCRGFPVVTHARVLAGYDYRPGTDVLTGESADDFVDHLLTLCDPAQRERLSLHAAARSAELFGAAVLDAALRRLIAVL
ncbi:MAG: glycosyltransferase [bacterium]|nr:glycosyltransferase [bacterium]